MLRSLNSETTVWVKALVRVMFLSETLIVTVLVSTQEYKWVRDNFLEINVRWISTPSSGRT